MNTDQAQAVRSDDAPWTAAEVGQEQSPADTSGWPRWEPPLSLTAVIIVVVTLAVGAWLSLRGQWTPVLDIAALEIRTQAMPGDWPQVGVFSRLGWYHPGPLFILQGWLPYRLWGPIGLNLAIVAVHVVSLVTAWLVARRIDRLAGSFVLLAAVVVLGARQPSLALEPWNPFAGLVSTVTLLVLAWACAQRMAVGPIVLLPLASYLLQSHLGYAPLVGLVVLVAAGLAVLPGQDRTRGVPWIPWLIGAVFAALLWAPVVHQQFTGDPGNITAIVTSFGESGEPWGTAAGAAVMSSAFALRPYWTEGLQETLPATASTPWWLLLTGVAVLWSLIRRDRVALRALIVCGAGVAAGFVAVTTASGIVAEYLVSWIPAVAATTIALSAWTLTRHGRVPRPTGGQGVLSAVLAVTAAAIAVVTAWQWSDTSQRFAGYGEATAALSEALIADAGDEPFNLGADPGASPFSAMDVRTTFYGLLAAAVREGAVVGAPEPIVWEVAGVVPSDLTPRTTYVVRNIDPERSDGARVVARWNPLSPAEAEQLLVLDAAAAASEDPDQTAQLKAKRAELLQGRAALELVVLPSGMVGPS